MHSVRAQYGMWLGHRLWTGWFVFERGTQRKISTFLWNWLALRGAILSLSGIKKAPTVKYWNKKICLIQINLCTLTHGEKCMIPNLVWRIGQFLSIMEGYFLSYSPVFCSIFPPLGPNLYFEALHNPLLQEFLQGGKLSLRLLGSLLQQRLLCFTTRHETREFSISRFGSWKNMHWL